MFIPVPDTRIFDWLGTDSDGMPYYLSPLNLFWSKAGAEHDLEHFRKVANRLADDPAYWTAIIRTDHWRYTLAGCTCLLASRRHEFFEDLSYRFREGSFVSPQIAVALGLLHNSQARTFFESILMEPTLRNRPKQAISAHRVLGRLGVQPLCHISPADWSDWDRDDAMIADTIVAKHWDFWSRRL